MEQATRDNSLDILKGIGIILMVMAHSNMGQLFAMFVAGFHMQLFFLVAGYLFKPGKYSFGEYSGKRAKRLLLPYLTFAVITLIICGIICLVQQENVFGFPFCLRGIIYSNRLIFPISGALWFLQCMFIVCIGIWLYDRLNRTLQLVTLAIVVTLAYLQARFKIWLPFSADSALSAFVFCALGYHFKEVVQWSKGEKRGMRFDRGGDSNGGRGVGEVAGRSDGGETLIVGVGSCSEVTGLRSGGGSHSEEMGLRSDGGKTLIVGVGSCSEVAGLRSGSGSHSEEMGLRPDGGKTILTGGSNSEVAGMRSSVGSSSEEAGRRSGGSKRSFLASVSSRLKLLVQRLRGIERPLLPGLALVAVGTALIFLNGYVNQRECAFGNFYPMYYVDALVAVAGWYLICLWLNGLKKGEGARLANDRRSADGEKQVDDGRLDDNRNAGAGDRSGESIKPKSRITIAGIKLSDSISWVGRHSIVFLGLNQLIIYGLTSLSDALFVIDSSAEKGLRNIAVAALTLATLALIVAIVRKSKVRVMFGE